MEALNACRRTREAAIEAQAHRVFNTSDSETTPPVPETLGNAEALTMSDAAANAIVSTRRIELTEALGARKFYASGRAYFDAVGEKAEAGIFRDVAALSFFAEPVSDVRSR